MPPTPRRKFTDSYKLGQYVRVKRYRHGWFDGRIGGRITRLEEYSCTVHILDGDMVSIDLDIDHAGDIYPDRNR